jgi:hypothetical protein
VDVLDKSKEVQEEQKEKMRYFWENVVTRTSRKEKEVQKEFEKRKKEGKLFDEQIYENQVNDKYLLINSHFQTVRPSDEAIGYTKAEIETYLKNFGTLRSKKETKAKETKKKEEKKEEEKTDEEEDEEEGH